VRLTLRTNARRLDDRNLDLRAAGTMASVMVDEMRLRAPARPLDEVPGDVAS
jgi:hypothetical protein